MKLNFIKFYTKVAFTAVFALSILSCDDDEPVTAGEGDPFSKDVVAVDATVSTTQPQIGEENLLPVTVTLGQSFSSDATITVEATLTNGNVTTGEVVVPSGTTTGSGSFTLPSDDGFVPAGFFDPNAGSLEAIAIRLDELVEGTTYVTSSNQVSLDIWSKTAPGRGGLNYVLDWEDPSVDLDLRVYSEPEFVFYENGSSGDRFEEDLFDSAGRPDGLYVWYVVNFDGPFETDMDYRLFVTQPDGSLEVLSGTFTAGTPGPALIPFASFEKSTNVETGKVSYINIQN